MDMFRENYKKAQMYAERVLLIKKGRFLETTAPTDMQIRGEAYVPKITQWFWMHGFRRIGDEIQTERSLQLAVSEWIRATIGCGCSAAFTLQKKEGTLTAMYGTGRSHFEGAFRTNIPECNLHYAEWSEANYIYSGLLTGTIRSKKLSDAFASSGIVNGYISCILVPISDEEVQRKIEENRELVSYLNSFKSFQRIYGNASRRVEDIPLANVIQAIALLKEETEYIEHNMGEGFVRTAVRFGAKTESDYVTLVSLIRSCIDYDNDSQSTFEPPRFFSLRDRCLSWKDCLAVPYVEVSSDSLYERIYAVTMQDVKSVTSFCLPPINSYDGYYVKNYNINEESMDAFPVTSPVESAGVEIGTICNSNFKAVIPFSALHSHAFVSGATETGKTTTVKKILTELYSAGIPFTVIEAAKKEYISLVGNIPGLKVYTPGNDGLKLGFNPLQPEDGVLIENHVAAVVRALIAATGGEHPIPEAYDGLLKQTYLKFGWKYGMMAYSDAHRPFPTFKDVFDNIDIYIAEHAKYGPEVRQNLTAALTLRTENMHSGAMGGLFNKSAGLQAKDLLESPCVIELADFSPQSAAFIMNILLFKFQSYLSRKPECGQLKRVIVIEEAHNIFKRTLAEDSGRAINNEYFDKMLSEIRSSGTGLILSDQRPGIMSEAVMANTSVKITHALVDGEDRKTVGIPSNLSEFQQKKLGEFKTGECVVAIRGCHGVQHVMVDAAKGGNNSNSACHVCTARFRCRRVAVKRMLNGMDTSVIAFHVSKIQANPYNIPMLEAYISNMLQDLNVTAADATKICLLGEMFDTYGTSSIQEKRIIVNSYSDYLRRRSKK